MKSSIKYALWIFTFTTFTVNPIFAQPKINDAAECLRYLFELDLPKSDSILNLISSTATKAYLTHYQLFLSEMILNKEHIEDYNEHFKQLSSLINNCNNEYTYLYLSEINLQRGIIEYKQNNKLTAIRSFKNAYNYWEKSNKTYPLLKDNLKLQGIFNLLIGNLPHPYGNWMSWIGYEGNTNNGFSALKQHLKNQTPLSGTYYEALLYLGFSHFKFDDNHQQLKTFILDHNSEDLPEFLQSVFIRCTFKIHEPKLCSNWLNKEKIDFAPLLYLKGKYAVLFNKKTAPSIIHIFLTTKSPSFKADALRYLSWHYLLQGDTTLYLKHQKDILTLNKFITDNDKQALFECQLNEIPNITLLKARLLFDRGDYKKTINWLNENTKLCSSAKDKLEYHYRLGRSYQMKNITKQALKHFELTIESTPQSKRYFAPYAAINAAKIHLEQDNNKEANQFLSKAEKLNIGEYQYDIEQEIKKIRNNITNH